MPATSLSTRRTRIVCIADTHNCPVKLPKGDVLIHAGDLTNQGSYSEASQLFAPGPHSTNTMPRRSSPRPSAGSRRLTLKPRLSSPVLHSGLTDHY